jgi:hypothetical protein
VDTHVLADWAAKHALSDLRSKKCELEKTCFLSGNGIERKELSATESELHVQSRLQSNLILHFHQGIPVHLLCLNLFLNLWFLLLCYIVLDSASMTVVYPSHAFSTNHSTLPTSSHCIKCLKLDMGRSANTFCAPTFLWLCFLPCSGVLNGSMLL